MRPSTRRDLAVATVVALTMAVLVSIAVGLLA